MPATSVLRELQSAHWACLVVPDGLPLAWTDDAGLAAQVDWFGDGRTIHSGLEPPTRQLSIVPFTGKLRAHRTSFTILDKRAGFYGAAEDYLADLFKAFAEVEEALALTLEPSATAPAALYNSHVGTEAIGAAGQRRRYPFVNGWSIGDHHLGADWEHSEFPTADVTDDPIMFRGRRIALYRVFRDHTTYPDDATLGWRPWSEAEILWWGTMADAGSVEGGRWTIECDGPESLLEKQLGALSGNGATLHVPITLDNSEDNDETLVGVAFYSIPTGVDAENPADPRYYSWQSWPPAPDNLSTTFVDAGDLADEIDAIIAAVAADTTVGTDLDFFGQFEHDVSMRTDGSVRIRVRNNAGTGGAARMAVMHLSLHEKVWTALGYAWEQGRQSNPLDLEDSHRLAFELSSDGGLPKLNDNPADLDFPPGPGYWTGIFATATQDQINTDTPTEAEQNWDNNGQGRIVYPLYDGGATALPQNLGHGLEVGFGWGDAGDGAKHSGQLDRPLASAPDDVSSPYNFGGVLDVTHQGVWLLVGPRRIAGQPDDFEYVVPVIASWREGNIPGTIGPGTDPQLLLTKWLNPQEFGIHSLPMEAFEGGWPILQNDVRQVRAYPIFRLGYTEHSYERPERILQRIMYSTGGSAGWTGYEGDPGATFATTSNEPTTIVPTTFDGEIADLGLAIPKELIANPNSWAAEFDKLPAGHWRRFRMLVQPGFQTSDLFEGLFAFYGLSWSLHGGTYGIRAMTESFTLDDVEVAITQSQKAIDPRRIGDERTRQELRVMQPINDFEIEFGWDPWDESFPEDGHKRLRANDRGARYRARGHTYEAKAYGIRNLGGWRTRTTELARFFEKRHFMLRDYPVKNRRPGQDIWPGTIVSITEPRAVSPTGTYGITTHVGMVTRISEDLGKRDGVAMHIDVLVQQDSAKEPRLCGPSGRVIAYDDVANTLRLDDNWLGVEDTDWLDANGFVEPGWSTHGGNIDIKCRSCDGYEWITSFTATVTSVLASSGDNSTLTISSFSGTFYRDMLNIVVARERANQTAAWANALLAVIGDEDGEYSPGNPSSEWHL